MSTGKYPRQPSAGATIRLPDAPAQYDQREQNELRRAIERLLDMQKNTAFSQITLFPLRLQESIEIGDNHAQVKDGFQIPTGKQLAVTAGSTLTVIA